MEAWVSANWWWVCPIVVGVGYITYRVRSREEGTPVFYAIFPHLAPAELARVWTPRAIILWTILAVVVLSLLFWDVVKHL